MSPRVDGMPEGHPEKQPVKIATLTLYADLDDSGNPTCVTGEIAIGPIPPSFVDEAGPAVIGMMHRVLDSQTQMTTVMPARTCACGRCGTGSGDAS